MQSVPEVSPEQSSGLPSLLLLPTTGHLGSSGGLELCFLFCLFCEHQALKVICINFVFKALSGLKPELSGSFTVERQQKGQKCFNCLYGIVCFCFK